MSTPAIAERRPGSVSIVVVPRVVNTNMISARADTIQRENIRQSTQNTNNKGVTMPCHVEKRGSKFAIVENATGKVKGHSNTRAKANASCRARNAAKHGWKPTRRK